MQSSYKPVDNFNIWYNTYDPDFLEISFRSRVPYKWLNYCRVESGKYSKSILKPINKYVERLYPYPDLVSIENNIVRLRQNCHADFFLLNDSDNFYNVDRPWIRQYYQSKDLPLPENCFPGTFCFYTPWLIDADISISYEPVDNSPFWVYPSSGLNSIIDPAVEFVLPNFVKFHFKNSGEHMEDKDFGIIKRGSPMFDVVFKADDTMVKRIKDFYENN
jgi:hypothetical protein